MRVLLATDGSRTAGVAVDLVTGLTWPEGSVIRIVRAVESGPALFGGPWPAIALTQVERIEADVRHAARKSVADVRARLARPGLQVESEVLRGRPASTIVDAARAMQADLIVLGSRGHGAIGSMLLGSVSSEVVDHADQSVLVARGATLTRMVLAWDGSPGARVAADAVLSWPILAGLPVGVVSVADIEVPWWTGFPATGSPGMMPLYEEAAEESRHAHLELASGLAAELRAAGFDAEPELRQGDAATELIEAAGRQDADLMVLGTHGRTGLTRLVLGSVSRNVLHHAACSVLIARERRTGA